MKRYWEQNKEIITLLVAYLLAIGLLVMWSSKVSV